MRAPWIWRQKQAQTPSTRESSMPCQPLCGVSLCVDGSTCGRCADCPPAAAGPRCFSNTSTGTRATKRGSMHMVGTNVPVRTYQGGVFARLLGHRPTLFSSSLTLVTARNSALPGSHRFRATARAPAWRVHSPFGFRIGYTRRERAADSTCHRHRSARRPHRHPHPTARRRARRPPP